MDTPAPHSPIQVLEQQVAIEREKRQAAEDRVSVLEHELAQLKRLIFGSKSERYVPETNTEQLTLFEEAPAVEIPREEMVAAHRRQKPVRKPLPDHLPREIIVIEPDMDRSGLKKIGEEITETLDYRPAKLIVIQRVRPKYVDPATEKHFIAQLPPRPIDKGIAEPGLLASVVVEKYNRRHSIAQSSPDLPPGAALQARRDPTGAFDPGRLGGPGG